MSGSRSRPRTRGSPPSPLASESPESTGRRPFDATDLRLIEALRKDSRAPVTEISRHLRIPRVTIQYRLRRLRERGAIRRFTILLDRGFEGLRLTAFTLVGTVPGEVDLKAIGEAISRIPGVVEVHDVTGPHDFIVKLRAGSQAALGERINRIRQVPGVGRTETLTCVLTYLEEP